ncbi:MAG: AtpZ/AtpI family protein [Myxococcaceae bacterium]
MAAPKKEDEGAELSPTARGMQAAAPYISAVWKLIGGAVFGVVVGGFLDKRLGTTPWMLVGLSAAGITVGFYAFIKEMLRLGKK